MVREPVSQLLYVCSIPLSSYTKRFKKVIFSTPLLGAKHERDSEKKKSATSLVAPLAKSLNKISPSLCGTQVVGPSSLPVVVAKSDMHSEHELVSINKCTPIPARLLPISDWLEWMPV